jgi:hypothetical protein
LLQGIVDGPVPAGNECQPALEKLMQGFQWELPANR